jgi:hypothetical protein
MTLQSQRVLHDALGLPPIDRAELVEQILAGFEFPARKDIDAAWAREAEERLYAFERGEIQSSPASEVFRETEEYGGVLRF